MVKIETRIIIGAIVIIFVFVLGYSTVSSYLVRYKTVSEVALENPNGILWINGTIVSGSFTSLNTGEYTFVITDGISQMNVSFTGELPSSLGTESQVVLLGAFRNSIFHATKMITKCPTKYES